MFIELSSTSTKLEVVFENFHMFSIRPIDTEKRNILTNLDVATSRWSLHYDSEDSWAHMTHHK